MPDPWQGLVTFVKEICTMQEGDAGYSYPKSELIGN
jgi:hypothetical protein